MKRLNSDQVKHRLLNMLVYIDSVLKKHNLKYSLAYGTLIGAARHKGFIPWDDDVDIVMPFDDYLQMLHLPEFKDKYVIYYPGKNQHRYNYPFAKVEDTGTKCYFKNTNDNGGLFIDIFPMTPLPKHRQKLYTEELQYLAHGVVFTFWRSPTSKLNFLHVLASPLYKYYRDKLKNLSFKYINCDYNLLIDSTWGSNRLAQALPKEWFNNYVELEFEGYKFNAISNYQKWLSIVYGNWRQLPDKDKQIAHHNFSAYLID